MNPKPNINPFRECSIYMVFKLIPGSTNYILRVFSNEGTRFDIFDYYQNGNLKWNVNGPAGVIENIAPPQTGTFQSNVFYAVAFVRDATSAHVYVGTNVNGEHIWHHNLNIPETTITLANIQSWRIHGPAAFQEIQIHGTMHDDVTVQNTHRTLVQKWKL